VYSIAGQQGKGSDAAYLQSYAVMYTRPFLREQGSKVAQNSWKKYE